MSEMKKTVLTSFIIMLVLSLFVGLDTFLPQVGRADGLWLWVMDTVAGHFGEGVVGTGDAIYIARRRNFYRYDPTDCSWVALAAPPNPDSGDAFKTGTSLAWDQKDYIYALYGAATGDSRRWFYRYSISTDSWQARANTTFDQGEGDSLAWVGSENRVYATIGGEQRPTYFMCYEPSTNSWSDEPATPPAGMGDGASLVWTGGDHLYALRGEFLESQALCDYWRYNVTNNTWTAMADIPALPHSGGGGGVGDGGSLLYVGLWLSNRTDYIYALSGNQAHPDNIPDNRTYRYTMSTNSWERLVDLPFGVGYYVGCRLGYAEGYIYAWQGAPGTWEEGGDDIVKCKVSTVDANSQSDGNVVINEVEQNPLGNDNYLSVEEWVELYNPTTAPVDISGWKISTTHGTPHTVTIPQGTIIPVGGYYVCGQGSQWLDNSDESVVLGDSLNMEVDHTPTMSDDENDHRSWQRYPNGEDAWQFRSSTRGASNGGEPLRYTLEISCTAGGMTDPAAGDHTYNAGDNLNVTAIPDFGFSFDYWLLDSQEETANPLNIVMDMNHSLTAHFVDDISPEITNPTQYPSGEVLPYQNVTVTVNVTDQGAGVLNATLWYSIDNGTTWTPLNMTEALVDTYQVTIPGYENCTWISYKIIAYDKNRNRAIDNNNGILYNYYVIPEFPVKLLVVLLIATTLATTMFMGFPKRRKS